MRTNLGGIDRGIRVLAAGILLALARFGPLAGTAESVAYLGAGVLLLTVSLGFCPLYAFLGINTAHTSTAGRRDVTQH